jgi:tetratricopeptide (TPR) repeat protein
MARRKTCFVIIGFGPKVDHETGRTLDLDKTFTKLIQPVFNDLNIDCFRAKEIRHTGIIDLPMYEWIYKADIVVADISTLNPNAIYELGVRHALRPFTTIVISENQLKYPFDLNHILIEKYKHLGDNIATYEAKRFKTELKLKVQEVLKSKKKDSPVYTFLSNLEPPTFTQKEILSIKKRTKSDPLFSEFIQDAESAKDRGDFVIAIELYKVCLRFDANNNFLKQRLALVTYKSEKPNPKKALTNAEIILNELNPRETNDTETLGLSGAINKRLYELTHDIKFLDKSLSFYQRGFYIQQDYYNGINYAYSLTIKSSVERRKNEAISFFIQANMIREQIVLICKDIIKQKNFKDRGDKVWVYQTLAQAYLGLGKRSEIKKLLPTIVLLSKGTFDKQTFFNQNKNLIECISTIRKKYKL